MATRILIADDAIASARLLSDLVAKVDGWQPVVVHDGEAALALIRATPPELVLLDFEMPGLTGPEVCRRLRADDRFAALPVVMVTAHEGREHKVAALEAGADDFINKPVDRIELVARVRSLLRIKQQFEKVQKLTALLSRFVSPQIAERFLDGSYESMLGSHRSEITVVFIDLRDFTRFSEHAQPEEVMDMLKAFHAAMGQIAIDAGGTIERFTGDGLMIFFNDPHPQPDAATRALRMALRMRDRAAELAARWRVNGHQLGLGIGVDRGYATLGSIGFDKQIAYGAVSPIVNRASRLCSHAEAGEILATTHVLANQTDQDFELVHLGPLPLRGFSVTRDVVRVVGERTS